jgi:hypothetical protein
MVVCYVRKSSVFSMELFPFQNSFMLNRPFYFYAFIMVVLSACGPAVNEKQLPGESARVNAKIKPGSGSKDTLHVFGNAIVFYFPDSMQLEKIKAVTDARVFEGSMHEFFYQQKNARNFLHRNWAHLRITDCKNFRWISFRSKEHAVTIIDLDSLNDSHGMIAFDGVKKPAVLDMTNAETEVAYYFRGHDQ